MVLPEWVLMSSVRGEVTLVVGRPGSGVSSLLAEVAVAAAVEPTSPASVLASWERPLQQERGAEMRRVLTPEIVGWTVEELGRCNQLLDAPEGTLVAVDYLQLVGPADEAAAELRALASERCWRLVLGVMAPRSLVALDKGLRGRPAIRSIEGALPLVLELASCLVMLDGGPQRHATLARRAPTGRWADVTTTPR